MNAQRCVLPSEEAAMIKPKKYILCLSGGKDSTAMLLRLLEEKCPIDLILFCDTGLEFPEMYKHLDRLETYIGRTITRLKAPHDFEYYFLDYTPKRKNPALLRYQGLSWAGPRNRWCTGILKARIIAAYLKKLKENCTLVEYVGIAADELKRIKDKTYPLIEWGMTEKDCLNYCYSKGFDWGGLYKIFSRVSCWCCPLQSLAELRKLYHHFPQLWKQLEIWDNATWRTFLKNYSVLQLAERFNFEDEWQAAGGNIRSKEFYTALRDKLSQSQKEIALCAA
ncbi:MAG: phosphoadenosine phosphosulfate reductase family protein [Monoglobaceae bacterium]